MSTPRFPRSKFVRRLLSMETELYSWAEYLRDKNIAAGRSLEVGGWDDRATAVWIAALDLHALADDMAHLPGAAQRRFARDDRSSGIYALKQIGPQGELGLGMPRA